MVGQNSSLVSPARKNLFRLVLVLILILFLFPPNEIKTVHADSYVVTTTDDSGPGSLRQALIEAMMGSDPDIITFDIPGSGVQVINLTSPLPIIDISNVIIDGLSQPGATCRAPLIELRGNGIIEDGIRISTPTASGSRVSGLAINGFQRGIAVDGEAQVMIDCNVIGVATTGSTEGPPTNQYGIHIQAINASSLQTVIESNQIAASIAGIHLEIEPSQLSQPFVIRDNLIGTDAEGERRIPGSGTGIEVINVNDVYFVGNVIAGSFDGVRLHFVPDHEPPAAFWFDENYIGVSPSGKPLGNDWNGLSIDGSIKKVILMDAIEGPNTNHIAYSGESGIRVRNGGEVVAMRNAIYNNIEGGIVYESLDNPTQVLPVSAVRSGSDVVVNGWASIEESGEYSIEWYANRNCHPSGMGEGERYIATNTVLGNIGDTLPITFTLSNVDPSYRFITALPMEYSFSTGDRTLTFSQCVPIGPDNDVWWSAFDLNPNPSATTQYYISQPEQVRWYRFYAPQSSQFQVDLKDLPADYELALFSDLEAAMKGLMSQDPSLELLAREQTIFDYDGFEASNVVTNTLDPEHISPEAYEADALAEGSFRPNVIAPYAVSPFKISPFKISPFKISPFKISPFKISPFKISPFKISPNSISEDQAGLAFDNAFLSATSVEGNADRSLLLNTWNRAGYYYIAVVGQNGAYNPTRPFTLNVSLNTSVCSALPVPSATEPLLSATAGNYQSIFLTDFGRLVGTPAEKQALSQKLNSLAARPEVKGVVVDVGQDGLVKAANAIADQHPSCSEAKNYVASAIKDLVERYRTQNSGLKYITLVGGDEVIPFFRYPDQAMLGNESSFEPPVQPITPSEASLRGGYILAQDAYGSSIEIPFKSTSLVVPQLAVGRLVETASDAITQIDTYVAKGGVLKPNSSFVSGYDFHYDSSLEIAKEFKAATNKEPDTLLTPSTESHQSPNNWTADDLRAALKTPHDLLYVAGHFSDGALLAADYTTDMDASELLTNDYNFTGSLVISPGCHAGYNTVDGHAIQGVTSQPDWAQALTRKGAILISGTGYQYGDTDFIQFGEELYLYVVQQLRVGNQPVALGTALNAAKQRYLMQSAQIRGIDLKTISIATLYGLPMWQVDVPGQRLTLPDPAPVLSGSDLQNVPSSDVGLQMYTLQINPNLSRLQLQLNSSDPNDSASYTASYLKGAQGIVAKPGEPVLPLERRNVAVPGTLLRGVALRSAIYSDEANVLPLTGAPATELRGVHMSFPSEGYYPPKFWHTNYFGALENVAMGKTYLHVTPSQFIANGPNSLHGTRRSYSQLRFRLFYNNHTSKLDDDVVPAYGGAPRITRVESSLNAGKVDFSVTAAADGEQPVSLLWVTYTGTSGPLYGKWESFDLTRDPSDPSLWKGSFSLPNGADASQMRFFVQAVSRTGLVALDTNEALYYRVGVDPAQPNITELQASQLTLTPSTITPAYGSQFQVEARLTSQGTPLANALLFFNLGTIVRQAYSDSTGTARVTLPASLVPKSHSLQVHFPGSSTHAPATAQRNITITKQSTSLRLQSANRWLVQGQDSQIVVTLLDSDNQPIRDQTIVFVVTPSAGANLAPSASEPFSLSRRTNLQGQVELGVLDWAPGQYSVTAFFAGDIPAPVSKIYDSPFYLAQKQSIQIVMNRSVIFLPLVVKIDANAVQLQTQPNTP